MRDALLELPDVNDAAVDYDKGVAYVIPKGEFDKARAIKALGESGKYTATIPQ